MKDAIGVPEIWHYETVAIVRVEIGTARTIERETTKLPRFRSWCEHFPVQNPLHMCRMISSSLTLC